MIAPVGLQNGDKALQPSGGGRQAGVAALSLVPGAKEAQKKFFSSSTDEISEASLAEGFSFPSMQALQKGQLSNPLASDFSPPEPKSPHVSPINRVSSGKPSGSLLSPYFKGSGLLDSFPPCPSGEPVASCEATSGKQQSKQLQPLGPEPGRSLSNLVQDAQERGSNSALGLKIQNLKKMSRQLDPERGHPEEPALGDQPSSASAKTAATAPANHIDLSRGNTSPAHQGTSRNVNDPPRSKEKMKTPDFVPMQTRRRSQIDLVGSPAPFCGDLEFPARPSPALSRRYSRHRWENRPVGSCTPHDRDRVSRHGSLPRMSAISKKRPSDHKHASRADLDRKKAAMYQVAQYWNECIRIAEEEKVQANMEIDKLHDELCRQDQEIQDFRANLDRKDKKLHDLEGLTRKMQEEKGHAAEEKTALSHQVETLRDELSEYKEQSQSLGEKFQICQEELHQTCREQRLLSSRLKSSHEMIDQLRKEKETRAADSDVFTRAIDESRKKREELKECVDGLRAESQRELLKRDETISELRSKIEEYEQKMAEEKEASDRLRAQFENDASSVGQMLRQLETKLDSLLAMNATSDNERESEQHENAVAINGVQDKLDSILTAFEMASSKTLSLGDLDQKLGGLSEDIMAKILPAIVSLSPEQKDIEAAISQLQTSVTGRLDMIQEGLKEQERSNEMHWKGNQNQASLSIGLLQQCKDDFDVSKKICQKLECRIDSWMEIDRQACQDAAVIRLHDAQDQLTERGERIKRLEDQLQLARDDNAAKLEALDRALLHHAKETTSCVQEAAIELRGLLEEEMQAVKDITEKVMGQNQDLSTAMLARIEESKDKSGSVDDVGSRANAEARESVESSKTDNAVVANLKSRINQLEAEAKTNERLCEQWRQDMKNLEVIRRKQKLLLEKLPLVQGFDAKMDRVVELSTSIQSTSQYLANETDWIGQQLESRAASRKSETPAASPRDHDEESPATPRGPAATASDVTVIKPEGSDPGANGTSGKREAAFRKVIVHSPVCRGSSADSPDAPSVKQEQRRRREATQVRPILKQHGSSVREVNDHSVDFSHLLAQNTRANSQATMGAAAKGIQSAARSSLARQCGYFFPTLADFESNSQVSNEGQPGGSKRPVSQGDGVDGQGVTKRNKK